LAIAARHLNSFSCVVFSQGHPVGLMLLCNRNPRVFLPTLGGFIVILKKYLVMIRSDLKRQIIGREIWLGKLWWFIYRYLRSHHLVWPHNQWIWFLSMEVEVFICVCSLSVVVNPHPVPKWVNFHDVQTDLNEVFLHFSCLTKNENLAIW